MPWIVTMNKRNPKNIAPPEGQCSNLVVFSDLDQTLLDGEDYSHTKAIAGLTLLDQLDIPLVLCTSKTLLEVEYYRKLLNNSHPFVIENGGAVYIPKNYFDFDFQFHRRTDDYFIVELGTPYSELIEAFCGLKEKTALPLRGFSDMTARQIVSLCGLDVEQANRAKQRQYDEPFLIPQPENAAAVMEASTIPITQGGQFYHLTTCDKGQAVRQMMVLFKCSNPTTISVGIGDALNDLALLEAVDVAILVQGPDGGYHPEVDLPGLLLAGDIGPAGWNDAIINLLNGVPDA